MPYQERITKSIQDFKDAVAEPSLDTVIEAIINKAYERMSGVGLWGVDSPKVSKVQSSPSANGYIYYLTISQSAPNKREIIFELLHEKGHAFDEIKLNPLDRENSERGREIRAWTFADEQVNTYPALRTYLPEYTEHKRKLLATYCLTVDCIFPFVHSAASSMLTYLLTPLLLAAPRPTTAYICQGPLPMPITA